jgi:hypothetical protein
MKKVVSIIVALFVFIGINAHTVKFDYTELLEHVPNNMGVSSFTIEKGHVAISFSDDYRKKRTSTKVYLGLTRNESLVCKQGNFSMNVSLDAEKVAAHRYIKQIVIETENVSPLANAVINSGLNPELTVSTNGVYYTITNNYGAISEVDLAALMNSDLNIVSISVSFGTFAENVTIDDAAGYTIDDSHLFTKKVTYTRAMNDLRWGTLCLPFAFKVSESNANIYRIYDKKDVDGKNTLFFDKVSAGSTIKAGEAVVFYCTQKNLVISVNDALISLDGFDENGMSEYEGLTYETKKIYKIVGTIKNISFTNGYFVSKNTIYHTTTKAINLKPFRAYIPDFGEDYNVRMRSGISMDELLAESEENMFNDNNETTAVESVETEEAEPTILGIFTADGKKVDELQKGLNIVKTTKGTKKIYIR